MPTNSPESRTSVRPIRFLSFRRKIPNIWSFNFSPKSKSEVIMLAELNEVGRGKEVA